MKYWHCFITYCFAISSSEEGILLGVELIDDGDVSGDINLSSEEGEDKNWDAAGKGSL